MRGQTPHEGVPAIEKVTHERRVSATVGCLLGGAVGDALGAPIEGWTRAAILEFHGAIVTHLVKPHVPVLGEMTPWTGSSSLAAYTDDTTLMLVLANTLIDEGWMDLEAFARKQCALYRPEDEDPEKRWLIPGAGHTETNFVIGVDHGIPTELAATPSEGCGAAMRVAPVGAFYAHDFEALVDAAVAQADLTHRTSYAHASAAAIALGVAYALRGMAPGPAFLRAIAQATKPICAPFAEEIDRAAQAVELDVGWPWGLPEYPVGPWVVPTALTVFAAHGEDFQRCVIEAVTFGGDNDSAGCMAGAIAGAYHGVEAIPDHLADIRDRDQVVMHGLALAGDEAAAAEREPMVALQIATIETDGTARQQLQDSAEPVFAAWQAEATRGPHRTRKQLRLLLGGLRAFARDRIDASSPDWFLCDPAFTRDQLPRVFELPMRKSGVTPSLLRSFLGTCAAWIAAHPRGEPGEQPWSVLGGQLARRDLAPSDSNAAFWSPGLCLVPTAVIASRREPTQAVLRYVRTSLHDRCIGERTAMVDVPIPGVRVDGSGGGDTIPIRSTDLRRVRVERTRDIWAWTHRVGEEGLEVRHEVAVEPALGRLRIEGIPLDQGWRSR